jgi:DNA polymerase-3 subunit epsilon
MRQVVLDTETTGLEIEQKHRIIEIGCVELFNRRLTGRTYHRYLNPDRDIDEGAQQVHGLTRERLARIELGARVDELCRVLDTLALARQMHPGQRNNLDALCKRYSVDNSHRDYHGALLDARILAEVYLAMTGGQAKLTLSEESDTARSRARQISPARLSGGLRIVVIRPNEIELAAHEHVLALLDKESGGRTVWRKL